MKQALIIFAVLALSANCQKYPYFYPVAGINTGEAALCLVAGRDLLETSVAFAATHSMTADFLPLMDKYIKVTKACSRLNADWTNWDAHSYECYKRITDVIVPFHKMVSLFNEKSNSSVLDTMIEINDSIKYLIMNQKEIYSVCFPTN
jgi:hypothetical protein